METLANNFLNKNAVRCHYCVPGMNFTKILLSSILLVKNQPGFTTGDAEFCCTLEVTILHCYWMIRAAASPQKFAYLHNKHICKVNGFGHDILISISKMLVPQNHIRSRSCFTFLFPFSSEVIQTSKYLSRDFKCLISIRHLVFILCNYSNLSLLFMRN